MLHPLQLQEVSQRYAAEIAEVGDYLGKAGIPVETPEAIGSVAARLRHEDAFRRDLTLHVWAIFHAPGRQVSYADAMAILAVASAGAAFAAEASEADTRELLRFVMEARGPFDARTEVDRKPQALAPAAPAAVQPVHFVQIDAESDLEPVVDPEDYSVPSFETEEDRSPRRLLACGIALCALLILCFGLWLHHQPSGVSTAVMVPVASSNPEAAAADREAQPTLSSTEPLPSTPRIAAGASNPTRAARAPRETPHARMTVVTPTAPRTTAARNPTASGYKASMASAEVIPTSASTPTKATAPPSLAKADAHPDNLPQPVARASRSDAPVYRGSDAPLVVLHTPVVRPVTLGNMASHLTYGPAPQYPAAAVNQNVQGEVKLEAEVDRTGNVISTRVVSGPPLLQEAAVNALQSWQYRPYLYAGKPIAVNATVVMDFQLQ